MHNDMTYLGKARYQAASAERTLRAIWFEDGPYLEQDDSVIVIPSPVFHPEIRDFWKSKGFSFRYSECGGYAEWWRLAEKKYLGMLKIYRNRANF